MTAKTYIVGLDLETTGLDQAEGHRIVEIALSVYDLNTAKRVGQYLTRVNPQRGIDPKAQEVHGISFEELAHEPVWEEVAPKVSAILARCKFAIAHNGEGFDMPFVAGELQRVGQPIPHLGLVDTMLQARWATPDGALPLNAHVHRVFGVHFRNQAFDVHLRAGRVQGGNGAG